MCRQRLDRRPEIPQRQIVFISQFGSGQIEAVIAFYVVGLNLIAIEKFLLIILASFPIIVALLYPISKINVLRFLFGMRIKTHSS